jgi:hypothetical protein
MALDPTAQGIGTSEAGNEPMSSGGGIGGGIAGEVVGQIMNAMGIPTMAMRSSRLAWAANTAHDFMSRGVEPPKEVIDMLPEEYQKPMKAAIKSPAFQEHAAQIARQSETAGAVENAAGHISAHLLTKLHNTYGRMDMSPEAMQGLMDNPELNRSNMDTPSREGVGLAVARSLFPASILEQGNESDKALAEAVRKQEQQAIEKTQIAQTGDIAAQENLTKQQQVAADNARTAAIVEDSKRTFSGNLANFVINGKADSNEALKFLQGWEKNGYKKLPDFQFSPSTGDMSKADLQDYKLASTYLDKDGPNESMTLIKGQADPNKLLPADQLIAQHQLIRDRMVDADITRRRLSSQPIAPELIAMDLMTRLHAPIVDKGWFSDNANLVGIAQLADPKTFNADLTARATKRLAEMGVGAPHWSTLLPQGEQPPEPAAPSTPQGPPAPPAPGVVEKTKAAVRNLPLVGGGKTTVGGALKWLRSPESLGLPPRKK